jgi:hypothetical protein
MLKIISHCHGAQQYPTKALIITLRNVIGVLYRCVESQHEYDPNSGEKGKVKKKELMLFFRH